MSQMRHQPVAELKLPSKAPSTPARAQISSVARVKASPAPKEKRLLHVESNSISSVTCSPITGIKASLSESGLPIREETETSLTAHKQPSSRLTCLSNLQRVNPARPIWDPQGPASFLVDQIFAPLAPSRADADSDKRVIQIGIEAEFVIAAWFPEIDKATIDAFVRNLANRHNEVVHKRHPRMQTWLRNYNFQGRYDKWCLVLDPSLPKSKAEPFGIELVSPKFRASRGSGWRQDVEATWKYLTEHYTITTTDRCSTHIHISLDPFFSTEEIKRIAQAVIHFETAFEALVPTTRRNNTYIKSNWLDSPVLAKNNRARSDLIEAIEGQVQRDELIRLMQHGGDKDYAWNFWSLYGKGTIEFRKPPGSTTSEEVLGWAELALSFIQASIKYESIEKLQKIPPTIGGLRWFVEQFREAGINEPARMQKLWAGKDVTAMMEPIPNPTGYWQHEMEKRRKAMMRLRGLAAADERQKQVLAKNAKPPYW